MNDDTNQDSGGRGNDGAVHVRRAVDAFLGTDATMDEVRALLRGWIDGVRHKNLPPEQALVEFKALLPLAFARGDARDADDEGHGAAKLISLFIQEYYSDDSRGDGEAQG